MLSSWGYYANMSLKEEVVYKNGEKGGPGNTLKHSEYNTQIFVNSCAKHAVQF